jgi:hypothetical protein
MRERWYFQAFYNLCYTQPKMQTDSVAEAHASWSKWANFLRIHQLDGLVAWAMEAAGPMTLIGAQVLYLGDPLIRPVIPGRQLDELVNLLEETSETQAFVAYLRGDHSS